MNWDTFNDYITRFNDQDMTAFERYLTPNTRMLNGTLELRGVQGVKDHYEIIWSQFTEELHIERFVSDELTVAIQMWAHFTAVDDDPASLFGPVKKGEHLLGCCRAAARTAAVAAAPDGAGRGPVRPAPNPWCPRRSQLPGTGRSPRAECARAASRTRQ